MGVACRTHGKEENGYKMLVRKPQGKSLLERTERKFKVNNKI
jgi:hypothetical protein